MDSGLLGRVKNKAENILGVSPVMSRKQDDFEGKLISHFNYYR